MGEITPIKTVPLWQESIDRFWLENKKPGSFLEAVLTNDLVNAVFRADDENLKQLKEIVAYCYNNLPHNIWGDVTRFCNHCNTLHVTF